MLHTSPPSVTVMDGTIVSCAFKKHVQHKEQDRFLVSKETVMLRRERWTKIGFMKRVQLPPWKYCANWSSGRVHFDFLAVCVWKGIFISFVMEEWFKLNAVKKFFEILSCSEFVGFLGYGNEVEAFANRFFSVWKW